MKREGDLLALNVLVCWSFGHYAYGEKWSLECALEPLSVAHKIPPSDGQHNTVKPLIICYYCDRG